MLRPVLARGLAESIPNVTGAAIRQHGDGRIAAVYVEDSATAAIAASDQVLAWSGRLDNREYLAQHLRSENLRNGGDADVVFAGYQRWQERAFTRLIGDWALVLWDPSRESLILARDFFGNRPLYYRQSQDLVVWSSALEPFLRPEFGGGVPDSDFLSRFLASRPTASQTPWEGVSAVAPGTAVIFSRAATRVARLWAPDLHAQMRYSHDDDYAEHFWQLFRQSVRDRLRPHRTVWAELSGGLDSSSVVCMAADLITRGEISARLQTVSYIFNSQWAEDEHPYIRAVEDQLGISGLHVPEQAFSPFLLDEPELFLCRPVGFAGRPRLVAKRMAESGARVLLRGHAGDAVMWSSPLHHPDLTEHIARGRFRAAHRAARGYSAAGMRTYWETLWTEGFRPLLPRRPRRPRGMAPKWLRLNGPSSEISDPVAADPAVPHSRRLALGFILDAIEINSLQTYPTCGVPETSEPFLDRRVVQFMLSVPFEQKIRPGVTRWLHRNALRGLLPPSVAERTWKASGDGVVSRALDRDWPRILALFDAQSRLAERGLVDTRGLIEACSRARQGLPEDSLALLRAIALEYWLRGVDTRAGRARQFEPGTLLPPLAQRG